MIQVVLVKRLKRVEREREEKEREKKKKREMNCCSVCGGGGGGEEGSEDRLVDGRGGSPLGARSAHICPSGHADSWKDTERERERTSATE